VPGFFVRANGNYIKYSSEQRTIGPKYGEKELK